MPNLSFSKSVSYPQILESSPKNKQLNNKLTICTKILKVNFIERMFTMIPDQKISICESVSDLPGKDSILPDDEKENRA